MELGFKRPELWSPALTRLLLGVVILVWMFSGVGDPRLWAGAVGVCLAGLLVWLAVRRWWVMPRQVPSMVIADEGLLVPKSASSGKRVTIDYRSLTAIELRGQLPRQLFVIATRRRTYVYPVQQMANAAQLPQFVWSLREKISQLPEGSAILERMDQGVNISLKVLRRPAPVTTVLLAFIGAVFALEIWTRATSDPLQLMRLGANVPVLVRGGEWYRLVTATFLHGGFLHLFCNGIGLMSLGYLLERLIGSHRFVIIFMVSAVAGSLASALAARSFFSLGASTALFGLLGAFAVINWAYRASLPPGFAQGWQWWLGIIVVNGSLPVFIPQIDYWGHLGGLAGGALVTLLIYRPSTLLEPAHRLVQVVAAVIVIGVAFAIVEQVTRGRTPEQDVLKVADAVRRTVGDGKSGDASESLNGMAWLLVSSDKTSRQGLEKALDLADEAVSRSDRAVHIVDTEATALYRLGRLNEAIDLEREALLGGQFEGVYFTQLGRFLRARDRQNPAAGKEAQKLVTIRAENGQSDELTVNLSGVAEDRGVVVYSHVVGTNGDVGLLRAVWPAPHQKIEHIDAHGTFTGAGLEDDLEFQVALVDQEECECEEQPSSWQFRAKDAEMAALP